MEKLDITPFHNENSLARAYEELNLRVLQKSPSPQATLWSIQKTCRFWNRGNCHKPFDKKDKEAHLETCSYLALHITAIKCSRRWRNRPISRHARRAAIRRNRPKQKRRCHHCLACFLIILHVDAEVTSKLDGREMLQAMVSNEVHMSVSEAKKRCGRIDNEPSGG